jgi:hypothetical protein
MTDETRSPATTDSHTPARPLKPPRDTDGAE